MIRRSSSIIEVESILPMRVLMLVRRTVVILSIIAKLGTSRPVVASSMIGSRSKGASTDVVVNGQTVTESVASKASSCTMTAGRGFVA